MDFYHSNLIILYKIMSPDSSVTFHCIVLGSDRRFSVAELDWFEDAEDLSCISYQFIPSSIDVCIICISMYFFSVTLLYIVVFSLVALWTTIITVYYSAALLSDWSISVILYWLLFTHLYYNSHNDSCFELFKSASVGLNGPKCGFLHLCC